TVTEVNDAPVAVNDVATVAEDGTTNVAVLTNDTPGRSEERRVGQTTSSVTAGPAHGSATVNPDGTIAYTPAADYNGPDAFTYKACDSGTTNGAPDAKCSAADVAVTVTEVNDAPVAVNDVATVAEDGTTNVAVLTNDTPG